MDFVRRALDVSSVSNSRSVSFASYTYEHPHFLIRYPHVRRLQLLARELMRGGFRAWLDYGAGDGAVFGSCSRGHRLDDVRVVLYEPWDEIRSQIKLVPGDRHTIASSFESIPDEQFDLITALEVLEHLPLAERIRFYVLVARRLLPGGRCLIEVPVEVGPILLLKEYGRRFLKGRRSEYTTRELFEALFGKVRDAQGRFHSDATCATISSHRGFDTFAFIDELRCIGTLTKVTPSPFPGLVPILNQCLLIEFVPRLRDPDEIAITIQSFAAAQRERNRARHPNASAYTAG